MGDSLQEKVVSEILRPLMAYIAGSENRKTLEHAGKLHFWSDGMLQELKIIRAGKGNDETYATLKKKFDESDPIATEAMEKLKLARDRLGAGPIAKAIDNCLAADEYGKGVIRLNIGSLINNGPHYADAANFAGEICQSIETLNAAFDRLKRMIEG